MAESPVGVRTSSVPVATLTGNEAAVGGEMEHVVESLGTGLGNAIGRLAETGVLFFVFAVIWLAFGFGLLASQGTVDAAWQTIRGLPLVVQVVAWILFLPVMAGLWAWETSWPLILRLVLVAGIAGWNLLVFAPKALPFVRS